MNIVMDIRSAAVTPRIMAAFEPELRPRFADTGPEAEGATDGRDPSGGEVPGVNDDGCITEAEAGMNADDCRAIVFCDMDVGGL